MALLRIAVASVLFFVACAGEASPAMDPLFETAVASVGPEYLRAEQALRARGPAIASILREPLDGDDPVAQLLARVLLAWSGERRQEYDDVLEFLDYVPRRLVSTPLGAPSPVGIAGTLEDNYGDRVADLLLLRLLKTPDWPRWQVLAVLFYLESQKLPQLTAPLVRYVLAGREPEYTAKAIEVLRVTDDPGLPDKLAAERRRRGDRPLPPELAALEQRPRF